MCYRSQIFNLQTQHTPYALQSDAFYDVVGSATTILSMLAAFLHLGRSEQCSFGGRTSKGHSCIVSVLSMALVLLWTLRLGAFLGYRIYRMGHDSRMDTIKTKPSSFFIAWTAQAVWVFSITLPATVLTAEVAEQGALEITRPLLALGMLLWVMGMIIAVPADWQKLQFRLKPENKVCACVSVYQQTGEWLPWIPTFLSAVSCNVFDGVWY